LASSGDSLASSGDTIPNSEKLSIVSPELMVSPRNCGVPGTGRRRLLALWRSGARVGGRANSGELLINIVRSSKPKALRGLNQKVGSQVQGYLPSPAVAAEPPANRQSLNHP